MWKGLASFPGQIRRVSSNQYKLSTAKVIDNLEMNRLREDDISKKEEERQRDDARAARGSQREPVVVVG